MSVAAILLVDVFQTAFSYSAESNMKLKGKSNEQKRVMKIQYIAKVLHFTLAD